MWQTSGLVRTWNESETVKGTYLLKRADVETVGKCTEIELANRTHKLEVADVKTDQVTDSQ